MLNNVNKIKYLKNILYKDRIKKKKIYAHTFKNTYNNIYNEKVAFSYKNKELIQIITFFIKNKSIFLIKDNIEGVKNEDGERIEKIKPNKKNKLLSIERAQCHPVKYNNSPKKNIYKYNNYMSKNYSYSIKNNENSFGQIYDKKRNKLEYDRGFGIENYGINKYASKLQQLYHENFEKKNDSINNERKSKSVKSLELKKNNKNMCDNKLVYKEIKLKQQQIKEYNVEGKKIENNIFEKNSLCTQKKKFDKIWIKTKPPNIINFDKYINAYETNVNGKNKIVLKYELNGTNNILTILKKCEEYNYVNFNLFDDICNAILFKNSDNSSDNTVDSKNDKKHKINLNFLIQISKFFIKSLYFNESFFFYFFYHVLNEHILSNDKVLSILYILGNIKKINTLHILFLYRTNFIITHRLYTFSTHQLYMFLSSYLKIYKCINMMEVVENAKYNDGNVNYCSSNSCAISNTNYEHIDSTNFIRFYLIYFDTYKEKENKNKNSINFIFFLINNLTKEFNKSKKIVLESITKFININDCMNKPFVYYIQNKIGCYFLKKVKSEYVIYNREERKRLYKIKSSILHKIEKEKKQKIDTHSKNGKCDKSYDKVYYQTKKFEHTQLKLINNMKKKIDARLFIPFIKIYDNVCYDMKKSVFVNHEKNKLFDFFFYNYKHMCLKFDTKSLIITLNSFSKKNKMINDEVLYMLINLIGKKINCFDYEQIIGIMNSLSNISNSKLSNNCLNFLIRFLFNNNKIIYLKDNHINILLNVIVKKKKFINTDCIYFIAHFVENYKPFYKNLKNIYLYFYFHYNFNCFNQNFLNFLYSSLISQKIITNFQDLNNVLSSTLLINNNIKYMKQLFKLVDTSVLYILKNINNKNNICLTHIDNIMNFIFYMNKSMTNQVYKASKKNLLIKSKKVFNCRNNKNSNNYPKTNITSLGMSNTTVSTNVKCNNNIYLKKNAKQVLFYFSYNSYNKIYYHTSAFNIKIFILIKQILLKFMNKQHCDHINNINCFIYFIKMLCNLYELQRKTNLIKKIYTYFYIAQNKYICQQNKIMNNYLVRVVQDIQKNILQFLIGAKFSESLINIFFKYNVYMLKGNYFVKELNNTTYINLYLQSTLNRIEKNQLNTNYFIFLMNFLSSYKIDEIVLAKCGIVFGNGINFKNTERISQEIIEMTVIKKFLANNKSENLNQKREKLMLHIYNEKPFSLKKRTKKNKKNVLENFFLNYKYTTDSNYLKKYEYKRNVYMNRIINNIEKKIFKRKIKKLDDSIKLNNHFKNINIYNKFLISKFLKKWEKKIKKNCILKVNYNLNYIETENIIELLFSSVFLYFRYFINNLIDKKNKKEINQAINSSINIYKKLIIYVLNKMVLLKKPKIINIQYSTCYYKLMLCICTLKYILPQIYSTYFYILMYWKKILDKNLKKQKTLKNYFDYVKSDLISSDEKLAALEIKACTHIEKNDFLKNIEKCDSLNGSYKNSNNKKIELLNGGDKEKDTIDSYKQSFLNLLHYPCISQTKYKYKLQEDNYNCYHSFENNLQFKNCIYYKNLVYNNMYEQYSYLQNMSNKVYLYFMLLKNEFLQNKRNRQNKQNRQRQNYIKCRGKYIHTRKKKKSILFRNYFNIIDVNKIDFFHNHLIRVDIKKNKSFENDTNTYFFFVYSFFNIYKVVTNGMSSDSMCSNEISSVSNEQFYLKRETSLILFLIQTMLGKQFFST
ncbi:conserved protein, unknown function, partial [Hepatocystis sp. ex Piliocolobus tephrosceles]